MRALMFVASLICLAGVSAAACPAGSVVVASTSQGDVCGRPVVGLNAEEQAQVPVCAASETLMRADTGFFICIPSARVPADAQPICFNGSRPLLRDGAYACRRAPAGGNDPGGASDLKVDIVRKAGETDPGNLPIATVAYQIAFLVVRVTNVGTRRSAPTDAIFGFPPDAPFGKIFQFSDGSECPATLVLNSLASCNPTRHIFAPGIAKALMLNARCAVTSLRPNGSVTCLAIVLRKSRPANGRTNLVDRVRVFVRVNESRADGEQNLANNEVVTDIPFDGPRWNE